VKIKKKSYLWSEMAYILFLLSVPKLLKNCFKIAEEKVWQKVAIEKFATFLTPFQASSTKICLQVKSSHC